MEQLAREDARRDAQRQALARHHRPLPWTEAEEGGRRRWRPALPRPRSEAEAALAALRDRARRPNAGQHAAALLPRPAPPPPPRGRAKTRARGGAGAGAAGEGKGASPSPRGPRPAIMPTGASRAQAAAEARMAGAGAGTPSRRTGGSAPLSGGRIGAPSMAGRPLADASHRLRPPPRSRRSQGPPTPSASADSAGAPARRTAPCAPPIRPPSSARESARRPPRRGRPRGGPSIAPTPCRRAGASIEPRASSREALGERVSEDRRGGPFPADAHGSGDRTSLNLERERDGPRRREPSRGRRDRRRSARTAEDDAQPSAKT